MVSALVMLSLFVGAVTMAMSESMETMKEEADAKDKARRLEKGKAAALALQNAGRVRSPLFGNANKGGTEAEVEEEEEEEEVMVGGKAAREKAKMKMLLMAAWDGTEVQEDGEDPANQYTGVKRVYAKVAGVMEKITEGRGGGDRSEVIELRCDRSEV